MLHLYGRMADKEVEAYIDAWFHIPPWMKQSKITPKVNAPFLLPGSNHLVWYPGNKTSLSQWVKWVPSYIQLGEPNDASPEAKPLLTRKWYQYVVFLHSLKAKKPISLTNRTLGNLLADLWPFTETATRLKG